MPNHPIAVQWQIATDERMDKIVQRGAVLAAARLQLIAATLYVPAIDRDHPRRRRAILFEGVAAGGVLVAGTSGLATDAIDHLSPTP